MKNPGAIHLHIQSSFSILATNIVVFDDISESAFDDLVKNANETLVIGWHLVSSCDSGIIKLKKPQHSARDVVKFKLTFFFFSMNEIAEQRKREHHINEVVLR